MWYVQSVVCVFIFGSRPPSTLDSLRAYLFGRVTLNVKFTKGALIRYKLKIAPNAPQSKRRKASRTMAWNPKIIWTRFPLLYINLNNFAQYSKRQKTWFIEQRKFDHYGFVDGLLCGLENIAGTTQQLRTDACAGSKRCTHQSSPWPVNNIRQHYRVSTVSTALLLSDLSALSLDLTYLTQMVWPPELGPQGPCACLQPQEAIWENAGGTRQMLGQIDKSQSQIIKSQGSGGSGPATLSTFLLLALVRLPQTNILRALNRMANA